MTLNIAQIVISLALIGLVLLQERSAGAGGLFGGGSAGSSYQTRRGLERVIYWATIVVAFIFAALSVASLILAK